MDIKFRNAESKDSEFAFQTKKIAFREYVEMVWGWDELFQVDSHTRHFDTQDFRIIQYYGKDVGVIAINQEPDCLKLYQLFLLPEF